MAIPTGVLYCPRCGVARPDEASFCMSCGAQLAGPAPERDALGSAAPPPPPAPPAALGEDRVALSAIARVHPPAGTVSGRRAGRGGWAGALVGGVAFAALTIGALAAAGPPDAATPAARWDPNLRRPNAVTAGRPFDLELEAANPATSATDRVWVLIDWRQPDAGAESGRLVGCDPGDCEYRSDPASGLLVVVWPGVGPGSHRIYRVTLVVDEAWRGRLVSYRVTAGTGASEARLRETLRWTGSATVQ